MSWEQPLQSVTGPPVDGARLAIVGFDQDRDGAFHADEADSTDIKAWTGNTLCERPALAGSGSVSLPMPRPSSWATARSACLCARRPGVHGPRGEITE